MTNPDNVGGLRLAEEVEAIVQFFHSARLFVTSREKIKHPEGTALYDEFLDRLAKLADGELCRAAPAGGDVECFVREMRTSKGAEFFVVVKRDGRELTPHMYTERWKAEYDVASWQHLLCGAPKPDILAYGPSEDSAPAGSGEVEECLMSSEHEWTILDCPHCGRCVKYCKKAISSKEAYRDLTAEVTSLRAERDALLRKLQQGAGEGREG